MKFRHSNGGVLDAPEERAELLRRAGFTPADSKTPAKKAASRKPSAKSDDE